MDKKSGSECRECGMKLPCWKCDAAEKRSKKVISGWAAYWANKKKKGDQNG